MPTIYVDRDCCGTAGANNRAMIAAALEREPNSIQLKVDALHIIFRLLRNTTDNHSRQTRFASALSRCFFVDNNMDVAVFRAERAKAGLVDKPASREEVRRHVRRMIPPPVELRRRLEACVRTFWELDCEGEASTHPSQRNDSTGEPLPGSVGAPLLKEGFWSAFRSVLVHVDGNCVSDSEDSVTFIRDGQGGLRHIRGSSRSECRHACIKKDFSQTSRVSGELYDCKLLWRMIFSNRRLKMKLGGEIDGKETIPIPLSCREYQLANLGGNSILVSSEPPEIVFGHEYLRLIDEERYSAICREWEEEKLAAEGCLNLDAEEDTGDAELEREILQHASGDGEEGVEFDVESAEDVPRNGAFEEIRSGGKARRKFCRLRGLHATNCIIKLENWSPYVTSVLRELISQVPDQNSETIYRLYVKRVLDEVDSAMRDCAVKAPLSLHSISLDDVKTYLKRLNHIRSSAIPATVRGQEAAARLELDLRPAVKLVFPEPRPGTQRLISPVPLDTDPTPVTSSDVIDDIVKRSALQGTAVQCSAVTAHTPHEATTEIASSQSRGTAAHSSNECVDVAEPPAIERPSTAKSGTPRPDPLKKICRFFSKPLVDGYNSHVPDGSKFGRCPLDTRPGMDAESKAMRTRARERAKSVTVAVSGVGRSCGMCGIRLTAVITGLDGSSIPKHEQFADEQGKHVRFCPLAENVPPDELETLRVLKKRRAEKKERRNSNKRRRYNDEKATGGPQ
ncbi:hypothetical protein FOL46_007703 [Perkinsus olseni]|uniref:Uncharacterized protein n=2 Tax=Perkinsus olseni TaxID=32597 RepID=A0A7J6LC29_PEROL|nr:hypothetical protein FOL46_007703 [Perkinsus olseni]